MSLFCSLSANARLCSNLRSGRGWHLSLSRVRSWLKHPEQMFIIHLSIWNGGFWLDLSHWKRYDLNTSVYHRVMHIYSFISIHKWQHQHHHRYCRAILIVYGDLCTLSSLATQHTDILRSARLFAHTKTPNDGFVCVCARYERALLVSFGTSRFRRRARSDAIPFKYHFFHFFRCLSFGSINEMTMSL